MKNEEVVARGAAAFTSAFPRHRRDAYDTLGTAFGRVRWRNLTRFVNRETAVRY
jgi:hypothetical protein